MHTKLKLSDVHVMVFKGARQQESQHLVEFNGKEIYCGDTRKKCHSIKVRDYCTCKKGHVSQTNSVDMRVGIVAWWSEVLPLNILFFPVGHELMPYSYCDHHFVYIFLVSTFVRSRNDDRSYWLLCA